MFSRDSLRRRVQGVAVYPRLRYVVLLLLTSAVLLGGLACVMQEDGDGSRVNELLAGVQFGMTSGEFFAHCRARNKLGEMTDGVDNYVQLPLPDSLFGTRGVLEFNPNFSSGDTLVRLVGRIYVDAWAPWNREYSGDSLLGRAVHHLHDELGGAEPVLLEGFRQPTYGKIDGNRRLFVRADPHRAQYVEFAIDDLAAAGAPSADFSDLRHDQRVSRSLLERYQKPRG